MTRGEGGERGGGRDATAEEDCVGLQEAALPTGLNGDDGVEVALGVRECFDTRFGVDIGVVSGARLCCW